MILTREMVEDVRRRMRAGYYAPREGVVIDILDTIDARDAEIATLKAMADEKDELIAMMRAWRHDQACGECSGPMFHDRHPWGMEQSEVFCPRCTSRERDALKAKVEKLVEAGDGFNRAIPMGPGRMGDLKDAWTAAKESAE